MVLLYVSAAWAGGILTAAILWGALGPGLALAASPLGASALVAWAACVASTWPNVRPDVRQGRRGAARYWQQAR